jgi:hypothetical protein
VKIEPWDLNVPKEAREYLRLMYKVGMLEITEEHYQNLTDEEVIEIAAALFQDVQWPAEIPLVGPH